MKSIDLPTPVKFHAKFSAEVLCYSDTAKRFGINNHCPAELEVNLAALSNLLGEVSEKLQCKLSINSGYRCAELNQKVGGVENSQHVLGLAADIVSPHIASAYELALAIVESGVVFDQLIVEFGKWVHISAPAPCHAARRELLTIKSTEEGYREGLIV